MEDVQARWMASKLLLATKVSTLTARRTSSTEIVPMAEDLRPAKGYMSGPRWHCAFRFTRQVLSAQRSKSWESSKLGAASSHGEEIADIMQNQSKSPKTTRKRSDNRTQIGLESSKYLKDLTFNHRRSVVN